MSYKILTTSNQKIKKGEAEGWATAGIHFAPYNLSGRNVCPMASKGCAAACLNTSGHGRYEKIQNSRIKKTQLFFADQHNFLIDLCIEIETFARRARKNGLKAAIRLNLTSDIQWEKIKVNGYTLFDIFPNVQFYDYTKIPNRMYAQLPANYHLTFSQSESNGAIADMISASGKNVAVVFDKLPEMYYGLRFLDDNGVIVGLTPKGRAKKDNSGFVVRVNNK